MISSNTIAPAPTTPGAESGAHTMECMEVWGGNQAAESTVKMPGLDVWVYSRPYQGDAGGGDVHYVSRCGTGRIARLLVADVSGHGKGASEIAVTLRNLMRKFVNYLDQSHFVESLNREFGSTAEGGNFATAVVGTYWAPTQYLVTCNAGHPRPMLFRARAGAWEILHPEDRPSDDAPANLPLGIVEPTRYDPFGIRLDRDDLVLIYTDSLIEARAPGGPLLGEQGLLEILNRLGGTSPEGFIAALLREINAFTRAQPPEDDVTVMLLRNTAAGAPRMSFSQSASAVWLFLGLVVARLRGGSTPIPWPELRLENIGGAIFPRLSLRWGAAKPGASA